MSPEEREAFERAVQRAKDLFHDRYFTVQPEEVEDASDNGDS